MTNTLKRKKTTKNKTTKNTTIPFFQKNITINGLNVTITEHFTNFGKKLNWSKMAVNIQSIYR